MSCAIVNGAAKCWGRNFWGDLGDGTNTDSNIPVQVQGLTSGVTQITRGYVGWCAIVNGAAKCWGYNLDGNFGDGTNTNSNIPVQVQGLTSGVTQLATDEYYGSCAIVNGAAKCWGYNYYGRLGDGTNTKSNTPVDVLGL